MLKFKKGGYTRHDSGTVYKVKDIFPNKYNPQVLLVSLVTRKRTYAGCRSWHCNRKMTKQKDCQRSAVFLF